MLTNKQNKITKFYRTSHLLSSVFLQDYVIFINFLNIEMLQKFKELINKLGFVNIIYINNINKNYIYNNKILEKNKLFLKSQE